MRFLRFLPLLVLCCAVDLAVPVAPTATGVEWEDDEDVVAFTAWRVPRPALARPSPRERARQRRVSARPAPITPARVRATAGVVPRPHLTAVDPPSAPPPGEDH